MLSCRSSVLLLHEEGLTRRSVDAEVLARLNEPFAPHGSSPSVISVVRSPWKGAVIIAEFRRYRGDFVRRLVLRHDPGADLCRLTLRLAGVGWTPLPHQGSLSITIFTVRMGPAGGRSISDAINLTTAASIILAANGVEVVNHRTMLIEFT
jgi:hypothetical protein